MNLADLADEQLVATVCDQQRDAAQAAFAELVRRHEAGLLRLFRRFHPCREDVSDVAQELWVRLWRSLTDPETAGRFDPARGAFGVYLFTMARNVARDWYRRRVRESARQGQQVDPGAADTDLELAADEQDSFSDVLFSDLSEAVARRLDDRERVVFALLSCDVPIGRICELSGLSQPSVWRIQQKLKKAIDEVIAS
jgi:RNA polymerase sigma factor (sigma-70 family)